MAPIKHVLYFLDFFIRFGIICTKKMIYREYVDDQTQ